MPPQDECPSCGHRTFRQTPSGRICTKCNGDGDYSAGPKQKPTQCHNCGRKMVFENQGVMTCRNCGVQYS